MVDQTGRAGVAGELDEAVDELRELARGIYPALLTSSGLSAALTTAALHAAQRITVQASGVRRCKPEIETAVYFSCLEGLQNVAKYAHASQVDVALARVNGRLEFSVHDDGRGFDPSATTYGSGLQGIADRLAALDGELEISSEPGGGTTIVGRVPVEGGDPP